MKKLVFIFLIANYFLNAQDTIRFADGNKRAVEITEVTSFGVKYYHFNNPQSKLLFAAKKDIKFIKYKNGEIDSLKKKVMPVVVAFDEKVTQNTGTVYDTIVFRNGLKKAVKVTEVVTVYIKYKRIDYMDGPDYSVGINDIKYIKYSNGTTDSFPDLESARANKNSPKIKPIDPTTEKITVIGKELFFREHRIGEKHLRFMMNDMPEGDKKNKMLDTYKEMRRYKRMQYTFGIIALSGAVVAAYTGGLSAFILLLGGNVYMPFISIFAGSGVFAIPNGVIATQFKKMRTAKKLELAYIFNE